MDTSSTLLDTLFTALGNGKRRDILLSLAQHPYTVGQLASEHQLSLPSIHRHIRDLEAAQLLQRKKIGRTNFVALRRAGVRQAQDWLKQFHAYWGNDEETLTNYLANLSKS